METNPPPPAVAPRRSLPASLCIGLMLTCIAWMALWIVLTTVALHAESLRDAATAKKIIRPLGAVMVIAGAAGVLVALAQLKAARSNILRLFAAWVWLCAVCAFVSAWIVQSNHRRWPLREIIIGTILTVILTAAMYRVRLIRARKKL